MELVVHTMQEIISMQTKILLDYERKCTLAYERAAEYAVVAARLRAMRELADEVFRENIQMRRKLFQSANEILDIAISQGDLEIARIAMIVIQEAQAKEII